MNSFTEILNHWGENFLNFAWPMLWQSSLLILVLFAFEYLFQRKVRASIRYALWLVVLVKLCVPPTFALPTSPAWWLHKTSPPIVAKPALHYTVTYDNGPLPKVPLIPLPAYVPPKPTMAPAAWLLMASAAVSLFLLGWLLVRWWQITRDIRRAKTSRRLIVLADEAQMFAGRKIKVQVKLTMNSMSPAVCGLFRPVILIPESLVENFSDEQLRAVMLHELIHLRRRDVWLNFVQALLQIFYWWHPLVWLANAHIRRVREEAVDDAVMLALREDAESYAPTLLEVAKLALNRPLASLGLVGILESRHSLRQRIERLVDFHAPRKAGLTLVSLLGILAFSAIAVPMGDKPAPAEKAFAIAPDAVEEQSLTVKVDPEIFIRNVKAQAKNDMYSTNGDYTDILLDILRCDGVDCTPPHGLAFNTRTGEITTQNTPEQLEIFRQVIEQLNRADGKCELPLRNNFHRKSVLIEARIYQMPAADFKTIVSGLKFYKGSRGSDAWWSVSADKFKQLVGSLESSGLQLIQRPRILTGSGMPASFWVGNGTNGVEFDCKPVAEDGFVDLTLQSTVISGLPGNTFTNHFGTRGAAAEDHGGIVVRVENFNGDAGSNLLVAISMEIVTNHPPTKAGGSGQIDPRIETNVHLTTVTGILTDSNFRTIINAIKQRTGADTLPEPEVVTTSGHAINRIRTDNLSAPLAQPASEPSNQTAMIFKLEHPIHEDELKERLLAAGVKIPPTVFFYQDNGMMLVRGTAEQLGLVERLVMKLNGYSSKESDATTEQFIKRISNIRIEEPPIAPMTSLLSRHFRVDTKKFTDGLRKATGSQTDNISTMARSFFSTLGVNLELPGKSVFFNDRLGELFVRATATDLDTIENALETLTAATPQIHIKARFLEVPKEMLSLLRQFPELTNGVTILPAASFRKLMQTLESNPGTETLAEPEVVTTSGRQTQMRATVIQTIITNYAFHATGTNSAIYPQSDQVETGPVLDMIPYALSDDHTINLTLIASHKVFLGYDQPPTNAVGKYIKEYDMTLPVILPSFRIQQASAQVNLWDGQTVVFGKPQQHFFDGDKEVGAEPDYFVDTKKSRGQPDEVDKELLVFITVTLVDPAGNRIHTDEDLPFAKNNIPSQSK